MSTKSAKALRPQYAKIVKLLESLQGRHLLWEIWQDAITMIACAISNRVDMRYAEERERLYMNTVSRYTREEAAVFPQIFAEIVEQLEANPEQDFLGDLYMQLDLGSTSARPRLALGRPVLHAVFGVQAHGADQLPTDRRPGRRPPGARQ